MKKEENKKIYLIIPIAIVVIIIALVYLKFFYFKKCQDYTCFNEGVVKCNKIIFRSDEKEAVWEYKVLGKKKGECVINVKLLMIKQGKKETQILEGKEMKCYLDSATIQQFINQNKNINPRQNLELCHGILKEEMQEIIIKNLWGVVLKNIGKIKEELVEVI